MTDYENQHGPYSAVHIERIDDGRYEIAGLPNGGNFRQESSYETLECGSLKIEGMGFACNGAEISEYQKQIIVENNGPHRLTNIRFEDRE